MEVAVGLWLTKHNFHLFIRQKLYSLPRNLLVIYSEFVLANILVIYWEPWGKKENKNLLLFIMLFWFEKKNEELSSTMPEVVLGKIDGGSNFPFQDNENPCQENQIVIFFHHPLAEVYKQ